MAQYKLIQNVEAEDHILGPLTLRQFIFALICAFCLYLSFLSYAKHAVILDLFFVPLAIFFGFFAIPFGSDQPTEIWALAKIRFLLKPRIRIWNQTGAKELVTITAPKKIIKIQTNGLNNFEVNSRLKSLANTLDSRGWAIKTMNGSDFDVGDESDRLLSVPDNNTIKVVEDTAPQAADILESSSPISNQFTNLIEKSTKIKKEQLINSLNSAKETNSGKPTEWFMPHVDNTSTPSVAEAPTVEAQPVTESDEKILAQIEKNKTSNSTPFGHMRTIQPLGSALSKTTTKTDDKAQYDAAIMNLAKRDDLTVQTIAHEANREAGNDNDEVVVSLR